MAKLNVNFDEVLKEISKLSRQVEGFTTQEMADNTGLTVKICREKLRVLVMAGVAYCSGRRTTQSMDGRPCHIPVYRMSKKSKS